ncbi:hypothetical protein RBB79_16990 [Tunturiibacter empetritectus]|uniref:Uncharacterized protein n=1 Tax=Tunturiibacter lichenicola TaxID=2051959 RepID=A0A852VJG7_9BACT|nr:hypothetical protein [Edaphobacter lichenicola]NYF91321.1 hypothetical protein [Edaphobacter lichenicola]
MMRKKMAGAMVGAVAGFVLACCLSVAAQEKGYWRAESSTAQAITGDIGFGGEKMSINFTSFVVAQIRALEPGEVSAVFDADSGAGGTGNLFRLDIPATKKFLHKNTLCGTEDVQWMATYVAGRSLKIAFFSGAKMPVFALNEIANSTDLCGTFSYVR